MIFSAIFLLTDPLSHHLYSGINAHDNLIIMYQDGQLREISPKRANLDLEWIFCETKKYEMFGVPNALHPIFKHHGYGYLYSTARPVTLRRPIFKQEKGFASLSLDLIYYSMASSQKQSHECPLNVDSSGTTLTWLPHCLWDEYNWKD
jgi:hypothetical protein